MGMRDWLDKLQKAAADKLKKTGVPEDPKAAKAAKKEEVRKMTDRTIKAISLAKKGVDQYNAVARKVDEAATDATGKAIELTEQVKPLAEKVDNAAASLRKKAGAFFRSVAKKTKQLKPDNAAKPSTGSGILDFLTPAVPEMDATKPKAVKDEPLKPSEP